MKVPRISLRTKLAIVAAFVVIALIGAFVGNIAERYKASEAQACREHCAKAHRSGELVSQNPVGGMTGLKYDGPWRCECR